jgi:hypothetical protein
MNGEHGAGVKSHAAWQSMLVAKMAAASDTAHQWSSFAPQNQRCLHGRATQPLKALADAGNEVAEVESRRNRRWHPRIGQAKVTKQAESHGARQWRRSALLWRRPVGMHQPRCLAPHRRRYKLSRNAYTGNASHAVTALVVLVLVPLQPNLIPCHHPSSRSITIHHRPSPSPSRY